MRRYRLMTTPSMYGARLRLIVNVIAAMSVVMLVITIALSMMSYWIKDPRKQYITIGSNLHITVNDGINSDAIGRLVLFNNSSYGPYRGSILWLNKPPNLIERHFGDTGGIYFRYFKTNQGVLWTLMISFWYPLICFMIAPAFWLVLYRLDTTRPGFCSRCRYDTRASIGNCPECGAELPSEPVK